MKTKELVPSAWCLVLSAVLCAGGLAAQAANVAKIVETGIGYPSISAACGAVANGQTIELLTNAPVTADIDLAGKTGVTITGNGTYCLTATVSRVALDLGDNTYDCDLATGDDGTFVIVSGISTYADVFAGPNILIEKWTQFDADQYDYLDPDAKPPLEMTFDLGEDGQWHFFAYPEKEVVAERESDRMQYNDLATAFAVVKDGQKITLLEDVRENVTVTKTVTFDMAGKLLDGSITAENTGTPRTNTLQNVNMTGDLKAQGDLRIIMESGTNTYAQAFTGTNLEFAEDTVFGYKQAKGYIADDMAMARTESDRWQVANTNRLKAAIGALTDGYQDRQAFLSAEDAVRLADNGDLIHFLANRSEDIELDQDAIDKNLLFDPTNRELNVTFTGVLKAAADVAGEYEMATTAEGYLYLTPSTELVAQLDDGSVYTNIAAAVAISTNGATVTLLKDWTENVTVANKTNSFTLGAFTLNGKFTATGTKGKVWFLDGTNTYMSAFEGNVELMAGTFSYEQKSFVTEGRILANNVTNPETWTVVDTNDIVAVVNGQQFVSFEKAVDYAAEGETIVSFKRSYDQAGETNIVFTSDMAAKAVANKLEFDPAGFAFPGEFVADGYVTAMNASHRLYLAPEGSLVARIGERPAFTNIADAVTVSTNGATVTLLQNWTENVMVSDKTNSFSFGAFELDGDLKATGAADKIVVLDGTNIYDNAFTGTNLEFAEDTVFGYKQLRDYIADDMAMARTETNRWQVVNTNRLAAAIGTMGDDYQDRQAFLSAEDAARLADNGDLIHFLVNRSEDIALDQEAIDKNLLFDPTNKELNVSFTGILTQAVDVVGTYVMATTAEGYLYLTPASNVVAKLDNGTLYTNIAAAVEMAVDGDTVTLLTNWTENVTVNGQTNNFSFGAFELTGDLSTDAAGKIVVLDGTNAYASAFTGPNLELTLGTTYGFKQLANFLPSDEFALAKTATNRWTVVKTNDLAVAIGDPTDYANYQVFTSPEEAIAMASYGDTLVFLKKWDKDVIVDAAGLAKNLKFNPGNGAFAQEPMRIKAEGYRLVQLPDRTFTLEPLGYVAKIDATREMKFKTFLAAMTYAAPRTERIIGFLQDFPDNILVPDDMMDKGFEFDTAGFAFDGTLYSTDPAYVQAVNARTNLYLALESDIVARINDDLLFTNAAEAVSVATNGAVVTVIRDCADDATAISDIVFQTVDGAVYGGPFFNGGHSVKTTLGSLFGTNLIEEIDWTDSDLTLINQTNGTWKVCPAATAMAQVRWTNRPTEVFDSVQAAFAWLRKFVDENPAEALNTYGIDVIGVGEHALDLGGQQLNWPINVSNEMSTTTVTNGEIYGDFPVVKGDVGTVVFGEGLLMTNRVPKVFKEPADPETGVRLWTEKGVYKYDPTAYCREGFVGAMRADRLYRIEAKGDVQIIMTDRSGADIHFKTLQDAFDAAPTLSTLRLYNNGAITATNARGRSFRITSDAVGSDGNGATTISGGEIVLADGTLLVSNIVFDTAKIIVKSGEGCIFTAGDDLEIKNAADGAVVVESGARMVVDGKNIRIWDNNGTNVVVRNPATGLVLVRDDNTADSSEKSRIGIWCDNYEAGQQFGMVAPNFAYPFFCDGDISVAEPQVYFTNDRDAALHHGKGATIVNRESAVYAPTNSVRWTGGFDQVVAEGHFLISRDGNELVWLAATNAPAAGEVKVTGRTATTLTFEAEVGCDYAVVTNGLADTNWVSITEARLAENHTVFPNKPAGTFTFTNLVKDVDYTFLKRYSITESTMVSPTTVMSVHTTSSSDELDIAKDLGYDTLSDDFIEVEPNPDGNGYIVTFKKDVHHGATLPDDIGKLIIDLNGFYLAGTNGQNGITFVPSSEQGRDYDPQLFADVVICGAGQFGPGRVVGGKPTNGTDATHAKEGVLKDKTPAPGGMGICATDEDCEGIILTLTDGVQVIGGGYLKDNDGVEYGNGGFGIEGDGADGVDGQPGIAGNVTNLIVRGAYVKGGDGGNGGSSTHGNGGNGGDGAAALGADAVVTVLEDATFEGGAGGKGGDSGMTGGTAGDGGNGGTALDPQFAPLAEGDCAFTGGDAGKGGVGHNGAADGEAGERGSSRKPSAPANDVEVLAVTGETIQFTAEPYMIYDLYEGDTLVMSYTNDTADVVTNRFGQIGGDVKANTAYTIASRYTANNARAEAESFEHVTQVTTTFWTAADIIDMFGGKAEVTLDADGNYYITLTDNVNGSVTLPENLGKVTLDLAGFEIVGTDGASGVPAHDGSAAIVIVASTDVDPLSGGALNPKDIDLTLTGDGELVGGNGGDSLAENPQDAQQGGAGAPAIANKTWSAGTVDIVVTLDGPTLRGGNGGKGRDALTGNGGPGGNGGDAVGAGIVIDYISGRARGGDGGEGGETRDKTASAQGGNGGRGGDANVYDENGEFAPGRGGNGGNGGNGPVSGNLDADGNVIDNAGAGRNWGVPGGVYVDEPDEMDVLKQVLVRVGDASDTANVRYYLSLADAIASLNDNETVTVIRNCTLEDDVEVLADYVKLTTENGAKITLNADIVVNSSLVFQIGETCDFGDGLGELDIGGQVVTLGGSNICAVVEQGGVLTASAGILGEVAVRFGGKFQVDYESDVRVTGTIQALNDKDVFLFGGTYDQDPSAFVREPFTTEGENPWKVILDPQYEGMVRIGNEVKASTDIVETFAEIRAAKEPAEIFLLQDVTVDGTELPDVWATGFLLDQNAVDVTIYGNGKTLTDARTDWASEVPLFALSGNVSFYDLNVVGEDETGAFIRLFEAKDVLLQNCTITGYDCQEPTGGAVPLIAASAAGGNTRVYVYDTVITGNSCSSAIDTTDLSGSGFRYTVHVAGETTIAENDGDGIYSDGYGQIAMDDELTGGNVEVFYPGFGGFPGKFATAYYPYEGVDNFIFTDLKTCGAFVEENGSYFVKWDNDPRQWAAEVRNADATNFYETVEEALMAVENGGRVILHNDCTMVEGVDAWADFTLDLNGKTLTNAANLLKFFGGDIMVSNGTLAAASKYALYVYGATVSFGDGLTVAGDIYVAQGKVVAASASANVTGALKRTTNGKIELTEGRYVNDPTAYLTVGRATCAIDEDGYCFRIVAAETPSGFEGDFKPEVTFSDVAGGKTVVDASAGAGKVTLDSKVILSGVAAADVDVKVPNAGWLAQVTDDGNGNAVVKFVMNEDVLKAGMELESMDPGERPLVFDTATGTVGVSVKCAYEGFVYYLIESDTPDFATWTFLGDSKVRATATGPISLKATFTPGEMKFFRVGVSDKW